MKKIKDLYLKDSTIVKVQMVEDEFLQNGSSLNLPSVCRVVIESAPGPGSMIISELWMPENWNGVFVGLGNGGMAGGISHDELARYAKEGCAVAHTDMGTSRGKNSGIDNPDVWKDFGWRATHIMTQVSKTILKCYYGKNADFSYFIGSSTGGQQAYSEAQRFPEDYDGILAGVPANNRVFLHTYFLWNHNHLRTRDGRVMFSADEVKKITDCAVEFFNEKGDGEQGDNFVTFPYINETTVDDFLAFLKVRHPEFSIEQLNSLDAVYRGPVNPKTNEQIYNGMPIGSEIYYCGILSCQEIESPHYYPFEWVFGEGYDGYEFDFADDLEKISEKLSAEMNANNADLTKFYKRGGKFLAFSGSVDPCVPYPDAVEYYNRVCKIMGGYEKVKSFFRYFIIPGKDHSNGGNGANVIWSDEAKNDIFCALRNWCEKGEGPEYLIAGRVENENELKFIRKVYPYQADREMVKTCDARYLD